MLALLPADLPSGLRRLARRHRLRGVEHREGCVFFAGKWRYFQTAQSGCQVVSGLAPWAA